jgi:two-component system, NarL family, sensor kinase
METQQKIKFYFGIVSAILAFLIIAGGFVLVFIRYQKRLLLKQQELFKLDAQYKQDLLKSNIESAEAERMRIAKDIHDEIGSIFSTLSLSVNQFKPGTIIQPGMLQKSNELIEMGINGVRRIAHSIIPFELELFGLNHALENHFKTIADVSTIEVNFNNAEEVLDTLNPAAALAIYRIVQELTSNCIKYAKAKSIFISIKKENDLIYIDYKDDGAGVDMENLTTRKGIGLKNIESRVIVLNGIVTFTSQPGKGFACNIRFPEAKSKK